MSANENCPAPEAILKALAEKNDQANVEHVHTCLICQQKPELQAALSVWQLLDALPEIQVSGDFEARLHSRLAKEQSSQLRWLRLDIWFDFFHIPALVAVLALLFWPPIELPTTQAQHWQRPQKTERIQSSFPVKTGETLGLIQKIYQQRSNKG
ncbi:MAG: hypothetical protein AB7I41_14825 [Candidatus Sericytochromatia bacterium]